MAEPVGKQLGPRTAKQPPEVNPLALLSAGGTLPTRVVATDEELSAADLWGAIREIADSNMTAPQVLEALDTPASIVSNTLRRERRKLALLFFGTVTGHMYKTTMRYQKLLDKVLDEVEKRDLSMMEIRELVQLVTMMQRWLETIHKYVVLAPPEEDVRNRWAGQASPSVATVNVLLQNVHAVKADHERELGVNVEVDSRPGIDKHPNPAPLHTIGFSEDAIVTNSEDLPRD